MLRAHTLLFLSKLSLAHLLLISSKCLYSLPAEPTSVHGKAELRTTPARMEIQTDDQSIIDWKAFSIAENETVQFSQPSPDSIVLNRVLGSEASQIFGQLKANGKILLLNPSGIVFGAASRIDVGSLIASTLDLQNELFLSGKEWIFAGSSSAAIVNEGTLHAAGDLFLAAFNVANRGTLKGQEVGLIAARELGISLKEDQRLSFRPGDTAIHTGSLLALQENLGGKVYILGDQIILAESAAVDASHPSGGGLVLIGGDLQGKNPTIANAKHLYIAPGVRIDVSATGLGHAGKAILWGDETTSFHGEILAQGGPLGGDGGFIEVSSKAHLDFSGIARALAPLGNTGTLLLDPPDITIQAAGPTTGVFGPCLPPILYTPGAAADILTSANLTAQLGGCNVVVQAASGNITVSNPVTWAQNTSLTLNAGGNITINQSIQNTAAGAGGDVILIAPTGSLITIQPVTASVYAGSQNGMTLIGDPALARCNRSRPNVTIATNAASANSYGRLGFQSTLAATTASGPIDVTCGNLLISAPVNNIAFAAIGHGGIGGGIPYTTTAAATITVDSSGTINLTGGVNIGNTIIGHGDSVISTSTLRGNICVSAAGNITMQANLATIGHANRNSTVNGATLDGHISVYSGGNITMNSTQIDALSIGHYLGLTLPTLLSGNIDVSVLGNLSMTTTSPGIADMAIGHYNTENVPLPLFGQTLSPSIDSNITVNVGGNLTLQTNQTTAITGIGSGAVAFINNSGNVTVNVGGNLSMATNNAGTSFIAYIGNTMTPALGAIAGNTFSDTNVSVGGAINLSRLGAGGILRIRAPHSVTVSSVGNITATGSGAAAAASLSQSYISTENNAAAAATTIRSGGTVLAAAAAIAPLQPFILGKTSVVIPWNAGIDFQTGSTLTLPYTLATNDGFVSLSSPTFFAAGSILPAQALASCTGCPAPFFIPASTANVPANTAANNLNGLVISTNTGAISITAFNNQPCPGAAAAMNIGALPANNVQILTATGSISVTNYSDINVNQILTTGSNSSPAVFLSACNDINVSPGFGIAETGAGAILLMAQNDINVNSAISSISGNISLLSAVGGNGSGNINLAANVASSASGDILLQAGAGLGCFDPSLTSSIVQTAGTVSTATGSLAANADFDINLSSPAVPSMTVSTGFFHTLAGHDTTLSNTTISKTGGGSDLLMISGRDMTLTNSHITANPSYVTLVVDNCFPAAPLIGPGAFNMDASSSIDPVNLRIFTALQGQNSINGIMNLNGNTFAPGALYADSATEHWCQYFEFPFPYPLSTLGNSPLYTIFYKDCLQQTVYQAQIIDTQFFVGLHPYNEFPGWMVEFSLGYLDPSANTPLSSSSLQTLQKELFYLRRRNLNVINIPKTWTLLTQ